MLVGGGRYYPPQAFQDQKWQGHSCLSDSSGPLFAIYLRIAEEQDQKRVEVLKRDTDQLLIFVSPCARYHRVITSTVRL